MAKFLLTIVAAVILAASAQAQCIPNTGYPWPTGGCLNAGDLNAAFAARAPLANPIFPGAVQVDGTVNVLPPHDLTRGLSIFMEPTGSVSDTFAENSIVVSPDLLDTGIGFRQALGVFQTFGGSTLHGGTNTISATSFLTEPTAPDNGNRNYVAILGTANAQTGDNGTSPSSTVTAKGALFAYGGYAVACGTAIVPGNCPAGTPATNLLEITGGEINTLMFAGSSAYYKGGWTIASDARDAVQGTVYDCEFCLSNQTGAIGWKDGILVGPMNGVHPLAAGGTLLRSISGTYTNGIDLSTDTISGAAWKSPGLVITGSGTIVLSEQAAPATPAAGTFIIFMDSSDHKLKAKGPSGTVTPLANP